MGLTMGKTKSIKLEIYYSYTLFEKPVTMVNLGKNTWGRN